MAATTVQLHPAIQRYLAALEASLRKTPGMSPDDGLADALEFLQSEWEALERDPSPGDDLYQHFVETFGTPEEVAAGYAAVEAGFHDRVALGTAAAHREPIGRPTAWSRAWRLRVAVAGAMLVTALCAAASLRFGLRPDSGDALGHAEAEPVWAGRVVSFRPGNPPAKASVDPAAALGPPDCRDGTREPKTYVSLGRGGQLVLEWSGARLIDRDGPDLRIVEIGPFAEAAEVSVSSDGQRWLAIGRAKGADATLDLAGVAQAGDRFRFVRLVDLATASAAKNQWPGADIDAVGALHSIAEISAPPASSPAAGPASSESIAYARRVARAARGNGERKLSIDPKAALGPPDCQDSGRQHDKYYCLGYGGELIVEFEHALADGTGADLAIFEVGYPAELVDVAVSEDGANWQPVGRTGRDAKTLDLAAHGLTGKRFRFVRLIDAKTKISGKPEFWGADIDAIVALHADR